MGKITANINTSLLMRVGSTEKIQQCYNTKTVSFGCAANWLNYALTSKNQSIGDFYECVFARLKKGDSRINNVKDNRGNSMGDHLLVLENEADDSCILRYVPTILKPVMCFYSFDTHAIRKRFSDEGKDCACFGLNLDTYTKNMDYSKDDSSYLFIKDPARFISDLKKAIPIAVKKNEENLTSKRFYGKFNPEEPLFANNVDYDKHTCSEYFYDDPGSQKEMFWKMPEYRTQSELRITIPSINFVNSFDEQLNYNYRTNILDVFLPNFQEYSMVVSAKEAHTLYFGEFDDKLKTCKWAISKLTEEELKNNV